MLWCFASSFIIKRIIQASCILYLPSTSALILEQNNLNLLHCKKSTKNSSLKNCAQPPPRPLPSAPRPLLSLCDYRLRHATPRHATPLACAIGMAAPRHTIRIRCRYFKLGNAMIPSTTEDAEFLADRHRAYCTDTCHYYESSEFAHVSIQWQRLLTTELRD